MCEDDSTTEPTAISALVRATSARGALTCPPRGPLAVGGAPPEEFVARLKSSVDISATLIRLLGATFTAAADVIDDPELRETVLVAMAEASDFGGIWNRGCGFVFALDHPLFAWQLDDIEERVMRDLADGKDLL